MNMSGPHSDYHWLDDVALATGLGLVLLGVVVMGILETVMGSPHVFEPVAGIVIHTSLAPQLRAYISALGFIILLVWGFYRVSRVALT